MTVPVIELSLENKIHRKKYPVLKMLGSIFSFVAKSFRFSVRWSFFLVLNIAAPLLGRLLRPDFVFLVYGNDRDRAHYWPHRLQKFLPPLVTIGVMWRKSQWGLVLGWPHGYRELLGNTQKLKEFLANARRMYPKAGRFALAGRLPGLCEKEGIHLRPPFVTGILGTVFSMTRASLLLATRARVQPKKLRFAVLGGAGTIGQKLVNELKDHFGEVVAFDPRYKDKACREENVIYSFDSAELRNADAAIVLTAKGEDIKAYAHSFGPGVVLGDDTHPCMSPELVAKLRSQGVEVYKVTTREDLRMVPRLPNFRSDDIPGCLLEAIVTGLAEVNTFPSQSAFNKAASNFGFEARLAPHKDA